MSLMNRDTTPFRTEVENLLLSEMVNEDAHYLVMGEGDDVEDLIPDNAFGGLFSSNTSSDVLFDSEDDEIEDDEDEDLYLDDYE